MTDTERDQIDNDAQMYMRTCHNSIKLLKNEAVQPSVCEQLNTHRDNVIEMLEEYLRVVCKLYSEQRAIRVKRAVDKKRISRLQPEHTRRKHDLFAKAECMPGHAPKARESNSENKPLIGEEVSKPDVEEELSPDEVQLFEQENNKLLEEMNNLVDEVRQIEGRVVEISQLQEIFSEKVLQQSGQIDRIYETAVGTTENVKDGNEHIREAIKNNASFRVWIIFFLVMCSFSLLFLDWYS
ncbi:syntaxin-18 isoform X2 [Nematostella vectensis]|nr:syntaxin-18 isoform X2 [Nematostella vectensis]